MSSCDGCIELAKERNRELDNLLILAKQKAIEDRQPKAICLDEVQGLFITSAETAIRERWQIKHVVSYIV